MKFLFFIITLGFTIYCHDLQALELRLKSSMYRGQLPVTIGDVFVINGAEPQQIMQIKQTPLSWQTAKGWNQSHQLLEHLDSQIKGISIKDQRLWLALCQPLEVEYLTSLVQDKMSQMMTLNKHQVRLVGSTLMTTKNHCLPLGVEIVTTQINWSENYKSRLSSVHQLSDHTQLQLWWQADIEAFVPVANGFIEANTVINRSLFDYRWVKALANGVEPMITAEQLAAYRSKKRISSGSTLGRLNIEKIRLIEKGQQLKLIYNNSGIYIESKAKALGSGDLNDVISVLAENGVGSVMAKIKQPGVVHAIF